MGKHINSKIKYHYVMRYKNGESVASIALEILRFGYSDAQKIRYVKANLKRWTMKFDEGGRASLDSNSGKTKGKKKEKPKNKDRFEDFTKDELIKIIIIQDKIIKDDKKSMYRAIRILNPGIPVRKLVNYYGVSKSGYYKWLKSSKQIKFDEYQMKLITKLFHERKGKYGYRRIHVLLQKRYGIKVNVKTVQRYMQIADLKSTIRAKRKKREIKDLTLKNDLIKRDFNASKINEKWFTDVSYIQTSEGWGYLSIIIDAYNNSIVDYKFSRNNDNNLVMKNVKSSILKQKSSLNGLIIHSDNGYQYVSKEYTKYLEQNRVLSSYSRIGNSLDNRPAEYLFSILKQEYLNDLKNQKYSFVENELKKIVYDYNNIRFQSVLKNLTPNEYSLLG